jgi:hypothetical protein
LLSLFLYFSAALLAGFLVLLTRSLAQHAASSPDGSLHLLQDVLDAAHQDVAISSPTLLEGDGSLPYIPTLQRWLSQCLGPSQLHCLGSLSVFPGSFSPGGAAAVSAEMPAAEMHALLQGLTPMALIQSDGMGVGGGARAADGARYAMHTLIRQAAGSLQGAATARVVASRFVAWMLQHPEGPGQLLVWCEASSPAPDAAVWRCTLREELLNLSAAAGLLREVLLAEGVEGSALADAGDEVGWVLAQAMGQAQLGVALCQAVLEAREALLGPDAPATLTAKDNLALTLGQLGQLARAKELQEQVLTRTKGYCTVMFCRVPVTIAVTIVRSEASILGPDHSADGPHWDEVHCHPCCMSLPYQRPLLLLMAIYVQQYATLSAAIQSHRTLLYCGNWPSPTTLHRRNG